METYDIELKEKWTRILEHFKREQLDAKENQLSNDEKPKSLLDDFAKELNLECKEWPASTRVKKDKTLLESCKNDTLNELHILQPKLSAYAAEIVFVQNERQHRFQALVDPVDDARAEAVSNVEWFLELCREGRFPTVEEAKKFQRQKTTPGLAN